MRLLLCERDATVGGVGHHLLDDIGDLLFQLVDKLCGIVLLVLDVTQFLFPDTCQLTALQQLLADEVDELDARRGGDESFAFAFDIAALEECLDDARSARWSSDTVLLHCSTEGLILHKLTRRLHRAQ